MLASQWRRLTRSATLVAVLTSPATFFWLHQVVGWSLLWSLVGTFFAVIAFRGMIDLVFRGEIERSSNVLYAHLGGQPAINGYASLFA